LHYTCLWSILECVLCIHYHFLEPTVRVSPKIPPPQPSRIPRLSSQRTTNARLIRDQVITEFHMHSPDTSFELQEVPSYLALHNLSLPSITSESNSESTSQPTSPTSASTQHLSPVSPICKGTSIRFLTSPIFSHSPHVHMYSPSSPLYHLQGSYL
jgi:hypothetical protein